MKIREAVVAGRFYPGSSQELRKTVQSLVSMSSSPYQDAIAAVVPHAGYIYSGGVAGSVYGAMQIPNRIILLGPNHTGRGASMALWSAGSWQTPLGLVGVDEELASRLKNGCPRLEDSPVAHLGEHSLEVQLPFLQYVMPEFSMVPLCIAYNSLPHLLELGTALAETIRTYPHRILMIVSSDMNHYQREETTRKKDRKAIDAMLGLDPVGLFQTVEKEAISMCGVAPAVAALQAARELGATGGVLIQYATSGDVSGDREQVVGYAGLVIH